MFSNEAHFWLNGYLNNQICRLWSEDQPKPIYSEKVIVSAFYGLVASMDRVYTLSHIVTEVIMAKTCLIEIWPKHVSSKQKPLPSEIMSARR